MRSPELSDQRRLYGTTHPLIGGPVESNAALSRVVPRAVRWELAWADEVQAYEAALGAERFRTWVAPKIGERGLGSRDSYPVTLGADEYCVVECLSGRRSDEKQHRR